MRQVDSPLPNLGQSRGPGIGSKGWVPRNTSGRVGAFIIGALAAISALSMIAASYVLKGEIQSSIPSSLVGLVVSFLAVMVVLCVGCWLFWYGGRLLMSSFRHSSIRKQ